MYEKYGYIPVQSEFVKTEEELLKIAGDYYTTSEILKERRTKISTK